nr:alpha-amylase family glycosyl hydrolase [Chloroflexaceae bacterium]
MTEKEIKRPNDETSLIEQLIASRRVPSATYRLQLNQQFTLDDAAALVPYLHQLGMSDVYISPPFVARTGSTHGYDVCDYSRISPALGGEEALLRLSAALRKRNMGLVLDMVPNHMGIGNDNPWWMDVLENGPASAYASFFDIDWQPVKPELSGKVLLPILDDQYGAVLERGGFRLNFEEGVFFIDYNGLRLPLAPRTYATALAPALEDLSASLDENDEALQDLQSIITAIGYLPSRTEQDPARLAERMREKEVIKRRLASLCQSNPAVASAIESAISRLNGRPNRPRSFDALEELLNAQPYRPAFWRVASEEINYRRFFDINDLAAIRVELPEVFAATHELVFRLLAEGHVTGLRIDHPDGLWDPPTYFRQLQQGYVQARLRAKHPKEGDAEPIELPPEARPLYVVAEKILSEREPLPHDWAVDGTTGYDFLAAVNGIFVNRSNERAFDRLYRRFIAPDDPTSAPSFGQVIYESKKLIMDNSLV